MASLIVQPIAEADIHEALEWYYSIQEKLADRLLRELEVVFDRIVENPEQFPIIGRSVRRALPSPHAGILAALPAFADVLTAIQFLGAAVFAGLGAWIVTANW